MDRRVCSSNAEVGRHLKSLIDPDDLRAPKVGLSLPFRVTGIEVWTLTRISKGRGPRRLTRFVLVLHNAFVLLAQYIMTDQASGSSAPERGEGSADADVFMQTLSVAAFSCLNEIQRGFATSMRLLDDSGQEGVNLLRSLAELFPPPVLFSQELRALPSVYLGLRNHLDMRGCNLTQHSSRRIMMTLATNVYEEQEEKEAAVDIVPGIMAAGRRNRGNFNHPRTPISVSPSATEATNSRGSSIDKVAHNVAMRL